MQEKEPRNPFYLLLLIASLVFVVNALAVALVPVLEQKAREAGQIPPAADLRDSLRGSTGLIWLLWELAAMGLFAFLSMGLDRYRSLKKQRAAATMPPAETPPSSS
jgi:hypothetical protein